MIRACTENIQVGHSWISQKVARDPLDLEQHNYAKHDPAGGKALRQINPTWNQCMHGGIHLCMNLWANTQFSIGATGIYGFGYFCRHFSSLVLHRGV